MALILRALQHQSTLTCLLWRSSEPGCTFCFFTPLCTFFPTFPICAWDLCNGFFCPEETCRSGPAHLTRSLYICPTPSLVGAKYCSLNNWTCWNWSRFPGHYQDRRNESSMCPRLIQHEGLKYSCQFCLHVTWNIVAHYLKPGKYLRWKLAAATHLNVGWCFCAFCCAEGLEKRTSGGITFQGWGHCEAFWMSLPLKKSPKKKVPIAFLAPKILFKAERL